jgi:hypothetical protein
MDNIIFNKFNNIIIFYLNFLIIQIKKKLLIFTFILND